MKKKFPEFIKNDKMGNANKKSSFEKDKLAGIKNQIDKLFL